MARRIKKPPRFLTEPRGPQAAQFVRDEPPANLGDLVEPTPEVPEIRVHWENNQLVQEIEQIGVRIRELRDGFARIRDNLIVRDCVYGELHGEPRGVLRFGPGTVNVQVGGNWVEAHVIPPARGHYPTDEQRLMFEERRAQYLAWEEAGAREAKERRLKQEAAREKAEATLMLILTPEQQKTWKSESRFELTGSLGGRYRIHRGYSHNVKALNSTGGVATSWCAHPKMYPSGNYVDRLPEVDAVIAQTLCLRTDEQHFLDTAVAAWGW